MIAHRVISAVEGVHRIENGAAPCVVVKQMQTRTQYSLFSNAGSTCASVLET